MRRARADVKAPLLARGSSALSLARRDVMGLAFGLIMRRSATAGALKLDSKLTSRLAERDRSLGSAPDSRRKTATTIARSARGVRARTTCAFSGHNSPSFARYDTCYEESPENGDMLGALTEAEIEQLLMRARVGRIGCHAERRIYVVPIAYAYEGQCVYAHSADGLKIRMMRANPSVCFEVDDIEDLAHWSSVIASGNYEELSGALEERASTLLASRFGSTQASASAFTRARFHADSGAKRRTIFFRMRLAEKTGRFER